jgi:uncharacterized protein YbaR (Trm112 family)
LDIDARIGKLTMPLPATFPARPAEISKKRLRDECTKATSPKDKLQYRNQKNKTRSIDVFCNGANCRIFPILDVIPILASFNDRQINQAT